MLLSPSADASPFFIPLLKEGLSARGDFILLYPLGFLFRSPLSKQSCDVWFGNMAWLLITSDVIHVSNDTKPIKSTLVTK